MLREVVLESIDKYLNCGILAHGCALFCCENKNCSHSTVVAFSCKRRAICPSCAAKRALIFAVALEKISITDDIVTYTTKDGSAHEFTQ